MSDFQTENDIFLHRQMREKRVILVDDADPAFFRHGIGNIFSVQYHCAFANGMQTGNRFEQNGLSRAGGSENNGIGPFSHGKIDLLPG